jgi:hypothetical protein
MRAIGTAKTMAITTTTTITTTIIDKLGSAEKKIGKG